MDKQGKMKYVLQEIGSAKSAAVWVGLIAFAVVLMALDFTVQSVINIAETLENPTDQADMIWQVSLMLGLLLTISISLECRMFMSGLRRQSEVYIMTLGQDEVTRADVGKPSKARMAFLFGVAIAGCVSMSIALHLSGMRWQALLIDGAVMAMMIAALYAHVSLSSAYNALCKLMTPEASNRADTSLDNATKPG